MSFRLAAAHIVVVDFNSIDRDKFIGTPVKMCKTALKRTRLLLPQHHFSLLFECI